MNPRLVHVAVHYLKLALIGLAFILFCNLVALGFILLDLSW